MTNFFSIAEDINIAINNIVWGPVMLFLLFGTGFYFTLKTNFLQIRKIKFVFKKTFLSIFKKNNNNTVSPFQAMTTALAGTVGTGNIVGSATAIAIGGPGALFWIIFSSFFGMMTKYSEILLAIKFREKKENGEKVGGPMYYIEKGLNMKWLSIIFSVFAFSATFGIGNIAQINSLSSSLYNAMNIKPIISGIVVSILVAFIIIGDSKRIAKTTAKIVPFMALFYIILCLIVLVHNSSNIPNSVSLIFKHAFKPTSAIGGFVGSNISLTFKKGMSNGIFSNEAGLGSAPIAHAMADTKSPVEQATWGIFEVFIDTMVVCALTGLVIISSGEWTSGLIGADLTIKAFSTTLGSFAPHAIAVSILFFSFSSMLSWSYYGEKCLEYFTGTTKFNNIYKLIFICTIVLGSNANLLFVWNISDTLNGLMAIPNLIAIISLSGVICKTTNEYFK
ncbi:sodium:alanine symporter family protein [Sedimentibacter sp. zth1]|uniref:alanine/glycine:cation symporter family protein n=1 Tax=Sedimentibacter sp. zth1 TaxID=2816908 RepID=UPI001A91643B|nr:sodium:alanine symporter family protein [Sedimentibacter sp. zth1]QSX05088.1 sodium:alanine symporter family protein [Sedimentibacter sp. zth1]